MIPEYVEILCDYCERPARHSVGMSWRCDAHLAETKPAYFFTVCFDNWNIHPNDYVISWHFVEPCVARQLSRVVARNPDFGPILVTDNEPAARELAFYVARLHRATTQVRAWACDEFIEKFQNRIRDAAVGWQVLDKVLAEYGL